MAVALRTPDSPPAAPESSKGRGPRARTLWLLGAIILLGAAVRFTTVSEQSFWGDEASTWLVVSRGFGHVWSTVPKTESTPPLYYVLLWLWSRLFGIREAGLRSFSALCGTLTIPVMWAIGRRLVSERVGLIAALLTAVNPLLFWYSQESRTYSMLVLTSATSLLALLWALEQPSRGRLLTWGLAAALAILSHYFAAVIVVPEAIWLALSLRGRGQLGSGDIAISFGPPVVISAALVPLLIQQNDGRAGFIADDSGSLPYRVGQLVKQDLLGDGQPEKVLLLVLGLCLVLAALALLWKRGVPSERAAARLPLVIGGAGVVLALVISATVTDYFNTRNLLETWPALALVVAIGLGCAKARQWGLLCTAGLAVLGLFCVANVIRDPNFQRDNWRGAVRAAGPVTAPRAIVIDQSDSLELRPYTNYAWYPSAGTPVREVDLLWLQRNGGFGHPIIPITPVPLPGFQLQVVRSSSYIVVRYRSAGPVTEPAAALERLYPPPGGAITVLQQP